MVDYVLHLKGTQDKINKLKYAFDNMEAYRDKYKGTFKYFWGMRKNWFPLVLLYGVDAGSREAAQLFDNLLRDYSARRFYYNIMGMRDIESFSIHNTDKEYIVRIKIYEGRKNHCCMIACEIIRMFGIDCYVSEA